MSGPPTRTVLTIVLIVLLATSCSASNAATPVGARQSIDERDLRRHVSFLASDTLEGRAAGSRGGQAAATYLAREFRRLGLTPAGDEEDFFQEFGQGYRNILALLPGSDPELRQEVILIGGHYDHVGFGSRKNSFGPYGQIHNGADDNASGSAAILEVAAACVELEPRPRRSLLFALWDAEEAGMLGSEYWVQHPSLTLDRVKLALNVDMVGRLRNDRLTIYGTRTAAGLRRFAALANQDAHLSLDFDWTQRDDSDHWTFCQQRIPYLMLFTGDHEDYHRPTDDVEKLNFSGLERISRMMFELARSTADATNLGGFRSEALQEGTAQQRELARVAAPPPRLGIAWDPQRESRDPFVIARVTSGSPAAIAGLQPGDRIVRIDGRAPEEIADLIGLILSSPGRLPLSVMREGAAAPADMEIALQGSPIRLGVQWRTDPAEPDCLIVTGVIPGSAAARAGVEAGDRLSRIETVADLGSDWLRELTSASNDSIRLQVEHAGVVRDVWVELPSARNEHPHTTAE